MSLRVILAAVSLCAVACGSSPTAPTELPVEPEAVSPIGGAEVPTDRPTLIVRNAKGFDSGQAQYTFDVKNISGSATIASVTVPAGSSTTQATFANPLPRGMLLAWTATARGAAGEKSSAPASFRLPAVACLSRSDPYAKAVIDLDLPFCARMPNIYNDPEEVLGPPNAGGFGPYNWIGFLSLGEGGHVTVDMETCAQDQPGPDIRVYQAVGSEPVTLYASGSPGGPFLLLEARKWCGNRVPGSHAIRYCDFDLASAEIQEARYFKVEDGELFPCKDAGTPSEGADIDAVQVLHMKP